MMWPMLLIIGYAVTLSAKELSYYIDTERPNVTYWNPKYFEYVKITAQRYRRDPIHYVNIHFKSLYVFGNEAQFDNGVYEFLSNEYRPSFFEMHFRFCDVFYDKKYDVFKPIYMKYINASSCPLPMGEYHFTNISVPNLPLLATFPFRKGRFFVNITNTLTGEKLGSGYIDAVIKQRFL